MGSGEQKACQFFNVMDPDKIGTVKKKKLYSMSRVKSYEQLYVRGWEARGMRLWSLSGLLWKIDVFVANVAPGEVCIGHSLSASRNSMSITLRVNSVCMKRIIIVLRKFIF